MKENTNLAWKLAIHGHNISDQLKEVEDTRLLQLWIAMSWVSAHGREMTVTLVIPHAKEIDTLILLVEILLTDQLSFHRIDHGSLLCGSLFWDLNFWIGKNTSTQQDDID